MNIQERAEDVIAQGCTTYSKRNDQFIRGVHPTHVTGGKGACLHFGDKWLVDHTCGLGSTLISCNNNYGLPHENEVLLAEMIRDRVKCIDKLKFLKTGTCATSAAVRIARAYHQNEFGSHKLECRGVGTGYHGTNNYSIAAEQPGTGTFPEGYTKVPFDKLIQEITYKKDHYKYCIIEPVELDYNVKYQLMELRELCIKYNIILIFDEVITGGRFLDYCVSNHFDIQPDIMCLGKALGNGYPLSVVGGKKEIMDTPDYFISSTFAGEHSAINEAIQVLNVISNDDIKELWERGEWYQEEFNKLSTRIQLKGYPTRAVWDGDETYVAIFHQEMFKRGYLLGKAWWVMFAHSRKILEKELLDSKEVIERMESGGVGLEGKLPEMIFKRN